MKTLLQIFSAILKSIIIYYIIHMIYIIKNIHIHFKKWKRRTFAHLGAWHWSMMLLGAYCPGTAGAQGILNDVNSVFNQRLETTCRYQEAVAPLGVTLANCYLQVGRHQFLLESLQTLSPDNQRVREDYLLAARLHDTVSVSKARYALSPPVSRAGRQLALELFHEYPNRITVEAGQVLLRADFSPLAVLNLQPGTARVGQQVWVQNTAPDLNGDTLACYELLPAPATNLYRMVLRERRTRGNRHWRHNNRRTCEWSVDLRQRRIDAVQFLADDSRALRWERSYSTATDFSETCSSTNPPEWEGLAPTVDTLYTRRFTRENAREARDTYTMSSDDATQPALTFSLISHYD